MFGQRSASGRKEGKVAARAPAWLSFCPPQAPAASVH